MGRRHRERVAVPQRIWRDMIYNALAAAGVTAVLASITAIPWFYLVPLEFLTGLVVMFAVVTMTANLSLGEWLTGWTVALAGWTMYVRLTSGGHWHWQPAAVLVAAVLVLTRGTAVAWALHDAEVEAEKLAEAKRLGTANLRAWDKFFESLGLHGIRTLREEPTRAGRTVTLELPPGSAKIRLSTLAARAEDVAISKRMNPGTVSFERGGHAGEVIMHLNEADILSVDIPFPAFRPLEYQTVTAPLSVGLYEDGEAVEVLLRQIQALVLGVTGGGKTNLLHVLIAQLTRCTDVIVWCIDFKGGRLAAPWLQPWANEQCKAPAIDWVATDRDEAEIMLACALDWTQARADSLHGGSKIHPTPQMPQLVIVGDEITDIFGDAPRGEQGEGTSNYVLAHRGSTLTRKGRSEAVMCIWTSQRGTVSMIGGNGDLRSQCELRFAMRTASEADAGYIIPDDDAAAKLLAGLEHRGSGLVWKPGKKKPVPLRFYRLDPDPQENPGDVQVVLQMAREAGNIRPKPEQLGLDVMGARYSERWERSTLIQKLRPRPEAGPPGPPPHEAQTATMVQDRVDETAAWMDITGHPDLADLANVSPLKPGGGGRRPDCNCKLRVLSLIAGRPMAGMPPWEVRHLLGADKAIGHEHPREVVSRWLSGYVDSGEAERLPTGNYRVRTDGRQQPPDQVSA